jgi:hypothetical protein
MKLICTFPAIATLDRNTKVLTGSGCYWNYDPDEKVCATCEQYARQCGQAYPFQCVLAGHPEYCGSGQFKSMLNVVVLRPLLCK